MKTNQDHWEHALEIMANNGTLTKGTEGYYPSDIVQDDIEQVLISRFSDEINDALFEPFSRAKLNGVATESLIDSYLIDYTNQIVSLIKGWGIKASSFEGIKNQMKNKLSPRYK